MLKAAHHRALCRCADHATVTGSLSLIVKTAAASTACDLQQESTAESKPGTQL